MKIIRNYLLKELAPPFFLSLLISTIILSAGNIIQMADLIINKGVGVIKIIQLMFLLIPSLFTFTIPISILSAVLLGFARLSSDNEITALRASGVSVFAIALPLILTGFIISLGCIPLNYNIMPEASFRARKTIKEIGVKNPAALIEPGVFIKIFKDYIIFVYDIKGNKLKNVRIYQPQENGPTRTLIAESGEIISESDSDYVKIKLSNGIADEVSSEDPNSLYKLAFKNYYLTLSLRESSQQKEFEKKARELTYKELKNAIKRFNDANIDVTPFLIEKHNKVSLAFSNLIFILLAIPIGIKTHRREKSINFSMALVLFLIYWTAMLGAVACTIRKFIPPWFGVWIPNVIFGCLAIVMFSKAVKK